LRANFFTMGLLFRAAYICTYDHQPPFSCGEAPIMVIASTISCLLATCPPTTMKFFKNTTWGMPVGQWAARPLNRWGRRFHYRAPSISLLPAARDWDPHKEGPGRSFDSLKAAIRLPRQVRRIARRPFRESGVVEILCGGHAPLRTGS